MLGTFSFITIAGLAHRAVGVQEITLPLIDHEVQRQVMPLDRSAPSGRRPSAAPKTTK